MKFRKFIKGFDESFWVECLNSAYAGYQEWLPMTLDEFLKAEDQPNFDFQSRYISTIEIIQ
jgi:hypothetical protein